jgi:hypothetical protein
MTKKAKSVKPDVTLMVEKEIFELLKDGKINMLLSWKPLDKKPEVIEVGTAFEDDTIIVSCKTMDTVGFGYRPLSYPAHIYARGKMTRFHIQPAPATEETEAQ